MEHILGAITVFLFMLLLIFSSIILNERRKRVQLLKKLRGKNKEEKQPPIDRSKLLARALSLIKEGIVVMDPYGRIMFTNRFARELLGIDKNDTGKFFYQAIKDFDIVSMINEAFNESYKVWQEKKIKDRFVQVIFGSDLDEKVLLLIDQTPIKKYENLKKDFIANASHELKTPLAAMKLSLETLEEICKENPNATKYILKAQERVNYMEQLIEDLITLSLLETTNLTIRLQKIKILPIVEEILNNVSEVISQKKIQVSIKIPEDATICADEKLIHAILKNLIDNAIKYNRECGTIEILFKRLKNEDEIKICDSGYGIPKSHIPFIFERFYRVERSRSRKSGGTGLGLSIVKLATEKLGGKIEVESQEGKGTCFSVYLPKRCDIITSDF